MTVRSLLDNIPNFDNTGETKDGFLVEVRFEPHLEGGDIEGTHSQQRTQHQQRPLQWRGGQGGPFFRTLLPEAPLPCTEAGCEFSVVEDALAGSFARRFIYLVVKRKADLVLAERDDKGS